MSAPPPLPPPPPGGDESKLLALNLVNWIFPAISTIFFAARIYTRGRITRNLGFDDCIMTFSMILLYITSSFVTISGSYGLGRHAYYLMSDPMAISNAVKYQVISEPFAIFGTSLPKISCTLIIIKLMGPSKAGAIWLWSLNALLNAISIVCVVTLFAQCSPSYAFWFPAVPHTCWAPNIVGNLAITQGAISAFTDFALALFPITILYSLQMSLKKKFAITLLLGVGIVAGVAAIVRTSKLAAITAQSDYTWETTELVMWVALETNLIIICACVPTLRPLVRSWQGKEIPRNSRTGYGRRVDRSWKSYLIPNSSRTANSTKLSDMPHTDSQRSLNYDMESGTGGIKHTTQISTTWEPKDRR